MRPDDALIDSPAGNPVALEGSAAPAESEAEICRLVAVPTVPVREPGLVTVTVLPPVPPPTIAWVMAQLFVSFDHDACSANVPGADVIWAAPPVEPAAIQAHSSEFSWPLYELPVWFVQPPAG